MTDGQGEQYEEGEWLSVSKLIELGLAFPGAKVRFKGEGRIVEVALVFKDDFSLFDSDGREHEWHEIVYPIIEPAPNVE